MKMVVVSGKQVAVEFSGRDGREARYALPESHHTLTSQTSPNPTTMPSEIFNPNPTIFTPSKASTRRRAHLDNSLWPEEENDHDSAIDDSDDVEPIDQEEIFGITQKYIFQSKSHSST